MSSSHPTHYTTLEVPLDATLEELRASYHRLALATHPDKKGGDVALFQAVQLAWETLSCPASRDLYNGTLAQQQGARHSRPGGTPMHIIPSEEVKVGEWVERWGGEQGVSSASGTKVQEWIHHCRCGDVYTLGGQERANKVDIVPCNGCSLVVKVLYEE
jgi:diphthamide biosynthesis protein 4